jgi:hypothetical protein
VRLRLQAVAIGVLAFLLGTAVAPARAGAAGYAPTVAATPGLSSLWRLGETGGAAIAADAAGAFPGTYTAATTGAAGAITDDPDTAVRLAGTGGVTAGDGPALAGPMTVEAWVDPDAAATAYLVSDGTTTTTGYALWLSGGVPVFTVRTTGGTAQVQAPSALSTRAWHHLAATVDATAVTLYVDGDAVATRSAPGTPRASAATLALGRYSGGGRTLRGGLDEVALYTVALDAGSVAAHAALGADRRAPATTLGPGPAAMTNARAATFTFGSAAAGATFECRLDAAAWGACTSPASLAGLADGSHTFAVRARSRYGVVDGAPPARTWTVDTVAPDTRAIAILPSAVQPTASVAFSSADTGARFECRLDGGAFGPCATPLRVAGGHVLAVRAVDAAGNADATPATVTIPAVAAAPPATVALTGPSAAFPLWTEGTGRAECTLDGGPWTPCGASLQTGALTPGAHALAVRAGLPDGSVQVATTTWMVGPPAPRLVGVQFPVLVTLPSARKLTRAFPASRLPPVRFSLNVAATVRVRLERTTGPRKVRRAETWTVAGTAGANVTRVPLAVYRRLAPARYRLTADAAAVTGRATARPLRFEVVRRGRH